MGKTYETFTAFIRHGAKELASVFYGPGTHAQSAELGMPFTKTPGEVTAGMRGERAQGASRDDPAPSALDRYTQPAPEQELAAPEYETPTIEQETPDLDLERD